jgi:HPt (histidine-containing phosphotransfer) domain-containing protein
VLNEFCTSFRWLAEQVATAAAAGDRRATHDAAHAAKGAASLAAAMPLSALLAEIEAESLAGDWGGVGAKVARVAGEFARIERYREEMRA